MIRPLPATGTADAGRSRAEWWHRVREIAPLAPIYFTHTIAGVLAVPTHTPDALLSIADALEDSASLARANGETELAAQLRGLADLPRAMAPLRVTRFQGEQQCR